MTELKPCPFCGSTSEIVYDQWNEGQMLACVECQYCGSSTGVFDTEEEAIEAWNMRTE